jgi:DNA repair protein RadC
MKPYFAREFKVVSLREQPFATALCETPDHVHAYWRDNIATGPHFNADVESFHVILLNRRNKAMGYSLASTGTLDTILVHSREVFRAAIVAAAASIVLIHNHPSGDPTPSSADLAATGDIVRAGQILKIDVLDHVIMGHKNAPKPYFSIRQSGLTAF